MDWSGDDALRMNVEERQAIALRTYEINHDLLEEHVNQEDSFRSGGYGQRQVSELLQNAVDALTISGTSGTIEFRIADGALYCANQGAPFTEAGIRSVCAAFLSPKREEEVIGRFGLGFKSVLGVSDNPQVFSQTVSFEFNGQRTAELIRGASAPGGRLPLMRVPSGIDVEEESRADANLAELMTWATTIVKLPLIHDGKRIRSELQAFRAETLLFMKSVSQLNISLQGMDSLETSTYRREGDPATGEVVLHTSSGDSRAWLFAERRYEPSEDVLRTLPSTIARQRMTVSYAVPKDVGRNPLGEVWAWFPLREQTTARGIFNAPWQVNDDRTRLSTTSRLNREMLEVCGELFIDVAARASTTEDPAAHLDLFPARGREARSIADAVLSEVIPRLARNRRLIPDADGILRGRNYFIGVPVLENPVIPEDQMTSWQSQVPRRSIPHPSAFRKARDRSARLRAILRDDDTRRSDVEVPVNTWLEELVSARTPDAVRSALQVFVALREEQFPLSLIGPSQIIPLEGGGWARADSVGSVLVPRPDEPHPAGIALVDSHHLDGEARRLLGRMGFTDVSVDQIASALGSGIDGASRDPQWSRLWESLLRATPAGGSKVLNEIKARGIGIRIQTRSGEWRAAGQVFATEAIAPGLSSRHAGSFHNGRSDLLTLAGCLNGPIQESLPEDEPFYLEYMKAIRSAVAEDFARPHHPIGAVDLTESPGVGPVQLLLELHEDEVFVADWTSKMLRIIPSKSTTGRFTYSTTGESKTFARPTPDWWAIQRWGRVTSSMGVVRTGVAVGDALRDYAAFLPVANSDTSRSLEAPKVLSDVQESSFDRFFTRCDYPVGSAARLTEVVIAAAGYERFRTSRFIPAVSGGGVVLSAIAEVVLASAPEDIALLDEHAVPYLDGSVANAASLVEAWSLRTSTEALSSTLEITDSGAEVPLLDRFPSLVQRTVLPLGRIRLQTSSRIIRKTMSPTGTLETTRLSARVDDLIVVDDSLDDYGVLNEVSHRLDLRLSRTDVSSVLADDDMLRRSALVERSRSASNDAERLLALVGFNVLVGALPRGLLGAVESKSGRRSEIQIAELFRQVKGFDSVWTLRDDLRRMGFPVPTQWEGSTAAQAFVRSLGFTTAYAGARSVSRPALQQVQGRLELSPLHDFQEELAGQIRDLTLNRVKGEVQRGLLYLPTGAGKTRVTAEAVVRMFVANELIGPVLWIAQSQELCEQAIQTWTDAWRALGDERVLDINRFWGKYEVDESDEELQIVVTIDDKLKSRIEADPKTYAWLAEASLVIIDEAHTALSPTYTSILRWLGLTASRTERPLLGLTATPYRGRNEEVNRLFVQRFGSNKLESLDPDDPIGQLRRDQVLAGVDHYVLDGSAVQAEGGELLQFRQMKDVSKTMLDRIGQDMDRTQTLVDDIMSKDGSWPILVFAASVSSAHTVAALLRLEGKRADAVDGTMRPQERRRIIEAFRSGETQILVNCELLTQGFDAPKIRALYIARPTFSPNRYHQMIGRGLRGPRNGGKERCLIVNIADTFHEFGEDLAFTEFNYLWEPANA